MLQNKMPRIMKSMLQCTIQVYFESKANFCEILESNHENKKYHLSNIKKADLS